jgi:hypothetical protein
LHIANLSPDFEPIEDIGRISPNSHDLEECEGYIRRQVPQLVRTTLVETARREMQPIEERLLGMLQRITQDSVEMAFREFRAARQHESSEPAGRSPTMAEEPSEVATTTDESLTPTEIVDTQPPTDFLDTIYNAPPSLIGDALEGFPFPAFSTPLDNSCMSDSGYGSGHTYCICFAEDCDCYVPLPDP